MTPEQRADERSSTKVKDLLLEIREDAHEDFEGVSKAHREAREDIKFLWGDQWTPEARAQYERDKRPMLVFPKLAQFHDRVYGSMLQKRPSYTVRADDEFASRSKGRLESGRRVDMAEAIGGMMRQIDAINNAQIAYLYAYDMALSGGFGHWRYRVDYKPYSFDKVIIVEPVWDVFSVIWDQMSDDITNDDARRCIVTTEMPKTAFEQQYPDAVSSGFEASGHRHIADWVRGGTIVVAERFTKRPKTYRLCELSDGRVVRWEDDDNAIRDELAKYAGIEVQRDRKHNGYEIARVVVSGLDVLEEEVIFPGENIPVVSVYGLRKKIDGKWCYRSLHKHAKDEQRSYNYARTRAIETVSLAPLSPFIAGASQVKGFEQIWKTANTSRHAYLPYDDTHNAIRPQREYASSDLSGIRDIIQMSEDGMNSAIGQYEAAMGRESNEKSGRAVLARAQQSEQIQGPFEENYHVALSKGGRIVADWIPSVYSNQAVAHILNEDGSEDSMRLVREEIQDEQTGRVFVLNDLSAGRYAIKVNTAPEFSTRRQESVQGLTEFAQAFPMAAEIIAPDILRNMDVPEAEKMARKVEASLPPEIRQAGEQDDDQEVPPQVQAAVEQAQQAQQEAQQIVQQVQQEAQAVVQERDALRQQLEAARIKAEQAAAQAKIDRETEMLGVEKRLFEMQQKLAEVTRAAKEKQESASQAA